MKISKKWLAITIIIVILGSLVATFIIKPEWAYAARDGFVDQVWDPGTKAGANALSHLWTSSAWQTYIAPYDWAISGVIFLVVGLVVIPKAWQKLRGRKTTQEVKTEKRSEPVSAISYAEPSSTGVKQEPAEEIKEET